MTIKILDRAFETTITTGTGAIVLQGAQAGFQSFSVAGNGAKVLYQINDGDSSGVVQKWETGIGTLTVGSPNTLSRDAVLSSTNNNQPVNFGTGPKNVIGAIAASALPTRDENLNFLEGFGTGGGTATAHTVALPVAPLAYSDGMRVYYYVTITNTGAFTVNVNALGNKSAKFAGLDPLPGLVTAGSLLTLIYNLGKGFFEIQPSAAMVATGPVGQCRLVKSGANLVLQPYNGNRLTISGLPQLIPSAGVTLPATGLASSTLYYIYAYMNGATMTLEASTTGHSTDTATGIEIKVGDPTRTLVGMAVTALGAIWGTLAADVASWFNRRPTRVTASFTANRQAVNPTAAELNPEIRNFFLTWGDGASCSFQGSASSGTASAVIEASISLNAGALQSLITVSPTSGNTNLSHTVNIAAPEGYQFLTLFGAAQTGTTATFLGTGGRGTLQTTVVI